MIDKELLNKAMNDFKNIKNKSFRYYNSEGLSNDGGTNDINFGRVNIRFSYESIKDINIDISYMEEFTNDYQSITTLESYDVYIGNDSFTSINVTNEIHNIKNIIIGIFGELELE